MFARAAALVSKRAAAFAATGAAAGALSLGLAAASCEDQQQQKGHDEYTDLDLSGLQLDHHLIHAGLAGEEKVHAYKLGVSADKNKLRATAKLGSKICGHPAIIHGGALAVLLDDSLGTLFLASGRNGYTAALNINYRKPVPSGTVVRIECEITKVEPSKSNPKTQKVWMAAKICDDATGALFTEATALFLSKPVASSGGAQNKYFPLA